MEANGVVGSPAALASLSTLSMNAAPVLSPPSGAVKDGQWYPGKPVPGAPGRDLWQRSKRGREEEGPFQLWNPVADDAQVPVQRSVSAPLPDIETDDFKDFELPEPAPQQKRARTSAPAFESMLRPQRPFSAPAGPSSMLRSRPSASASASASGAVAPGLLGRLPLMSTQLAAIDAQTAVAEQGAAPNAEAQPFIL